MMRFVLATVYQFLNFYISLLSCQCRANSKMILFKKQTNWNGDLYAFNLLNMMQREQEMHQNIDMIMHCKKASIEYLEQVERISLNISCDAKAICQQECISECLQIYGNSKFPPIATKKVSNYAHQNYMVLQQRIFYPEGPVTAITVFAASYNVWLDNQFKFLNVRNFLMSCILFLRV